MGTLVWSTETSIALTRQAQTKAEAKLWGALGVSMAISLGRSALSSSQKFAERSAKTARDRFSSISDMPTMRSTFGSSQAEVFESRLGQLGGGDRQSLLVGRSKSLNLGIGAAAQRSASSSSASFSNAFSLSEILGRDKSGGSVASKAQQLFYRQASAGSLAPLDAPFIPRSSSVSSASSKFWVLPARSGDSVASSVAGTQMALGSSFSGSSKSIAERATVITAGTRSSQSLLSQATSASASAASSVGQSTLLGVATNKAGEQWSVIADEGVKGKNIFAQLGTLAKEHWKKHKLKCPAADFLLWVLDTRRDSSPLHKRACEPSEKMADAEAAAAADKKEQPPIVLLPADVAPFLSLGANLSDLSPYDAALLANIPQRALSVAVSAFALAAVGAPLGETHLRRVSALDYALFNRAFLTLEPHLAGLDDAKLAVAFEDIADEILTDRLHLLQCIS